MLDAGDRDGFVGAATKFAAAVEDAPELVAVEFTGTPRAQAAPAVPGGDFRSAMADALKSVSQTQFQAQRLQRELSLDNPAVSLEETMLAMQKSQLGFQATLQVRNRLVSAYSEIMNMQV